MANLAKLDLEPRPDRGPDVEYRVSVPAAWLNEGASIECELPRRLSCASCRGGGCDTCRRSGALSLYEKGAEPRRVVVHLSAAHPDAQAIRVPDEGAVSAAGVRGCLILHVAPGSLSAGVRRLGAAPGAEASGRGLVVFALVTVLLVAVAALAAWTN